MFHKLQRYLSGEDSEIDSSMQMFNFQFARERKIPKVFYQIILKYTLKYTQYMIYMIRYTKYIK